MASTLCSSSLANANPGRTLRLGPCFSQFLQYNPLCSSLRPSLGLASRQNRYKIKATNLTKKEKKVSVEESLSPKTDLDKKDLTDSDLTTRPGFLEKNVIKVEQSINIFLTETIIKVLNKLYSDRPYARFYVLENVARVPYFAFISVLHLYESFGLWRRADYIKVHFAESWNEMHHLLIMEELGGNSFWLDRILAQSMAFVYYFVTVFMYMLSPRMAYHFSECVEKHAFSTYDKFIKLKGEELKKFPAPEVAIKYYMNEDLYLFDEFQTERVPCLRKPKIENLYDVFMNIRDDEAEHCKTMKACQTHGNLRSPHTYQPRSLDSDSNSDSEGADCEGITVVDS